MLCRSRFGSIHERDLLLTNKIGSELTLIQEIKTDWIDFVDSAFRINCAQQLRASKWWPWCIAVCCFAAINRYFAPMLRCHERWNCCPHVLPNAEENEELTPQIGFNRFFYSGIIVSLLPILFVSSCSHCLLALPTIDVAACAHTIFLWCTYKSIYWRVV